MRVVLSLALSAAAAALAPARGEAPVFHAAAVSLRDVEALDADAVAVVRDELRTVGLVQITQAPGMAALRQEVLRESALCGAQSASALTSRLPDGGRRRTMAVAPGSAIAHGAAAAEACARFDAASERFRALVDRAARAFASAVDAFTPRASFLERAGADNLPAYDSFAELAARGAQLEHFHSYLSASTPLRAAAPRAVDMHLDQGLFIAFAPALMVGADADAPAGRFTIALPGGVEAEAAFAADALVFMLGDGVNQYVNPRLPSAAQLRATPHALALPTDATHVRSWYGRMFLPPPDAVSAAHGGAAFAQAREQDIAAALLGDAAGMALGCSGGMVARELQQESCEENQLWCWHRCQNLTDAVNETACDALGLDVKCTNAANDKVWVDTSGHSAQFVPRCSDATVIFVATTAPSTAPSAAPSSDARAAAGSAGGMLAAALLAMAL